jgi:hypothetical protein
MTYKVEMLTTVAECETLLLVAEKEKKDLLFRKTSLERQKDAYSVNSLEIDQDLQATETELTALQGVVSSLPEGKTKVYNEKRIRRLDLNKFLLTQKDKDYGSVALLVREFDLGMLNKELEEVEVFIAAITARKAAL